ncbi:MULTISPECIES: hypothetical protein [Arthrobacter]|uniref:Uncharacterized protein n=1 Tax=Arthrobacter terricola TaxID=2547396 RepID=A0A4R5KJC7_9MICC|nr:MULTISPECIES: hypothetical protein [Arthrobacter]MBT8161438.1 hypothetical protein [Arthrobacter sp. GN70]TDF95611.1 hypothetical protein E1809_11330 [Arthrobacter terricola]
MIFDKDSYWKRRMNGERGQGDKQSKGTLTESAKTSHVALVNGTVQKVSRSVARRKVEARFYKGEHDTTGKRYTAKGVRHKDGSEPFAPAHPSSISNHQRLVMRHKVQASTN